MYEWTNTMTNDNAADPTTQVTTLGGDLGIMYDFPLDYDDQLYLGQELSLYLGGPQRFQFTSPYLTLDVKLKLYPIYADILRNEIWFNSDELTFCDSMWYGYELMKVVLDVHVGIKRCYSGVYDFALADTTTNYTCEYEYTYLDDLVDCAYKKVHTSFLVNTCNPEELEEMEEVVEGLPTESEDIDITFDDTFLA